MNYVTSRPYWKMSEAKWEKRKSLMREHSQKWSDMPENNLF